MSVQRANQLIEAGLWLRLSGDLRGAQRLFERALELDPGNVRAKEYLDAAVASQSAGNVTPFSPPPAEVVPFQTQVMGKVVPAAPSLEGDWGAWAEGQGGPQQEGASWKTPAPVFLPETPGGGRMDAMDLLAREDDSEEPQVFALEDSDNDTPEAGASQGDTQEYGVPSGEGELEQLLRGAEDLLELDDHSGAVDLLFKAQELAPGDPRVEALRQRSERMLMAMLESKLGDLGRVPRVRLQPDDIIWLNLDHRAGFVLAQIDGAVTYEDLFALSGMTRLDTARILAQLLDEGVIVAG
ncbi:tetratricopeptide repeat protein [Pyxidicoccus parkwayensis]|uniref:Tetratricopeptide repeat protein n=1 Tax=Pyxidicoccus parkwayensis TaxID=2813578 RepID=A0ABX7PA57_9BACT|nr:tetratricopeptide repeat protein [Pyxidicoccus parkwaysis]QSQ27344.1 tetratricopeptide repeat protein [Pyxidicoccus parkwaysis]